MIHVVDQALERLVRTLPLPEEAADVAFDTPDGAWGARLSRPAVSLFLYDVARSPLPGPGPARRAGPAGTSTRPPVPLVVLRYAVTVWAQVPADEHRLLGDVLGLFLDHSILPPALLPVPLPGPVLLGLVQQNGRKPGDVWGAIGGRLRAGFDLDVTAPLDRAWVPAALPVSSVQAEVARREPTGGGTRQAATTPVGAGSGSAPHDAGPADAGQSAGGRPRTYVHRRGTAVVLEQSSGRGD